jgi:hypothetical protein
MDLSSALELDAAEELWLRFKEESDMSDIWDRFVFDEELVERSCGLTP